VKKMVRLGPWKLHVDRRDEGYRLYDLTSDPGELRDRTGDQKERVSQLVDLLEAHERGGGIATPIGKPDELLRKQLEALGYMEPGE
jgi:hypothetical protein